MLRLTRRQTEILRQELDDHLGGLMTVVIDDGQSVGHMIDAAAEVTPEPGRSRGGVARFRISDYLGTPTGLVKAIRSAVAEADLIILHAGGTQCPPALVELVRFIADQEFSRPRFLIVVERLDLACAAPELVELVNLCRRIDLTLSRDSAYFREIAERPDLDERSLSLLVDLFENLLAGPLPHVTTRSLDRTCSAATKIGVRRAVELEYIGALPPGPQRDAVENAVKEALGGRSS